MEQLVTCGIVLHAIFKTSRIYHLYVFIFVNNGLLLQRTVKSGGAESPERTVAVCRKCQKTCMVGTSRSVDLSEVQGWADWPQDPFQPLPEIAIQPPSPRPPSQTTSWHDLPATVNSQCEPLSCVRHHHLHRHLLPYPSFVSFIIILFSIDFVFYYSRLTNKEERQKEYVSKYHELIFFNAFSSNIKDREWNL